MSKKSRRHEWPEAKKLCQLDDNDIVMAKRLGFTAYKLIRAQPSPRQGWKLPVKEWIRELHLGRFGTVLGEEPPVPAAPQLEYDEEAVRRYGEQLYWEDYFERNAE